MGFAEDIAVTRVGPGSFTAELHERWESLVGIHGASRAPEPASPVGPASARVEHLFKIE